MKKLTLFLFSFFVMLNLVAQTNGNVLTFKERAQSFSKNFNQSFHQKDPFKDRAMKISLSYVGIGLTSAATGLVLNVKARHAYKQYKTLKNDILYNSNTFTESDLQNVENNRSQYLSKANTYRRIGDIFYGVGAGFITLSIVYYINTAVITAPITLN